MISDKRIYMSGTSELFVRRLIELLIKAVDDESKSINAGNVH